MTAVSLAAGAASRRPLITFSSDRDGDPDTFRMRADGSSVEVLTSGVWTDESPAWRP